MAAIKGKRVAIVATDGVEAVELTGPQEALKAAGVIVDVVSLKQGQIQGFDHDDPGPKLRVDRAIDEARAEDYDGLVLPGGVANPDKLRTHPEVIQFVKHFFLAGKPVASICHGPWTLIEAGVVSGRTLTSWPSLKTDILNAGGKWVDEEVVTDQGLTTSRKPDDIPAFNRAFIEELTHAQVAVQN